ncbi:hypothetical protein [Burkholderia gladioli]|uniref:hypothetical protein n=1 Tax=Burkholderia gladioli TaxID=28095 RepID=UPI00163E9FB4|nr:hypothetical protein [Burkholderia gladioli]
MLSYTKLTQAAEAEIRARLDAAVKDGEAGNIERASCKRAAANGAFGLWQTLSLQHLDALARASYAADFARLYELVSPERTPI